MQLYIIILYYTYEQNVYIEFIYHLYTSKTITGGSETIRYIQNSCQHIITASYGIKNRKKTYLKSLFNSIIVCYKQSLNCPFAC